MRGLPFITTPQIYPAWKIDDAVVINTKEEAQNIQYKYIIIDYKNDREKFWWE